MFRFSGLSISAISILLLLSLAAHAEETTKERVKGLDEQIQEIKTDVLGIAAELSQLEEKLLYPSDTQAAIFISLAGGEDFRLDSVEIVLDGEPVTHHLYTYKELEALRRGGVQRIHTGNLRTGEHTLEVTCLGKSGGGSDLRNTERFTIEKGVGPEIVEIILDQGSVSLRER